MLHVFSGLILGLLSLSLMYYLNGRNINLNSIFIAIYMLSFAALGGILWEVYEFTIDNLFNMDMQGVSFSGVTDTMEDFIADLVGGFISSIYGYIKFKK
ncbi:hypothetical protein [Clostridium rectalis]|uniref:hypothetical protein n=1 Tax=Clostridium rectalis TaxID=2040295 RepID=UPI001FAAE512|nr:hypothetical protein [Clostridium rectalis]